MDIKSMLQVGLYLWEFNKHIISIITRMNQQTNAYSITSLTSVTKTLENACTYPLTQKQVIKGAIKQLNKINNVFMKLNNQQHFDEQCSGMGELAEIIKLSRQISKDLNSYCKKYLSDRTTTKINYKSIFWGKVRDAIISANQKIALSSIQKQQLYNYLVLLLNLAVKGQIKTYSQSHKQTYSYVDQRNYYIIIQQQVKKYGVNYQSFHLILTQFISLGKVEEILIKLAGVEKQKNTEISKRFHNYVVRVQNRQILLTNQNNKFKEILSGLYIKLARISENKITSSKYSENIIQKSQDFVKIIQQKLQKLKNGVNLIGEGLAKILNESYYYRAKEEDPIERCRNYTQKLQTKFTYYKANELTQQKRMALNQTQNLILKTGKKPQKYTQVHDYYEDSISISQTTSILNPMIEDYKKVNQVHIFLLALTQEEESNPEWYSISQRCLALTHKIRSSLDIAYDQIARQFKVKWPQNNRTSIKGLIKMVNFLITAQQNKNRNSISNTASVIQPQSKYDAILQQNYKQKLKQQVQIEIMSVKACQIRQILKNDIFKQIEQAGISYWKDFRKKYERELPPSGKDVQIKNEQPWSVTDQIIWKVFKCTRVPLQLTQDKSIFQLLESGKQKQDKIQQMKLEINQLKSQIKQLKQNDYPVNRAMIRTSSPHLQQRLNELEELKNRYIGQYQQQKQLKQKQIKTNQAISNQLATLTQEYQTKFEQMKQKSRNLQTIHEKKIKQKQAEIQNFNELLKKLITQKKQAAQKIVFLEAQVQSILKQLTKQQQNNTLLRSNRNQTFDKEIKGLQGKIVELEKEINQYIEDAKRIFQKKEKVGSLKQMYRLMADELDIYKSKKEKYKKLYSQAQAEKDQSLKNIQKMMKDQTIKTYTQVENKVESLLKQISQLQSSQKKQTQNNQRILSKLNSLFSIRPYQPRQQQPIQIKQQNKSPGQVQKLILDCINAALQAKKQSNNLHIRDNTKMFANQEDELFVVSQLQKYLGKRMLTRFNLLYRSSQGGNIKAAVDKKPNTLLIIKTTTGHTIGCYSSRSYCGTWDCVPSKGVLISTFSNASYNLISNFSPTTPSDDFLIFGNQAIKLSLTVADNLKMFIKFDSSSGFQTTINGIKHTVYNICGEHGNEVDIEGFEIYQVQFQGKDEQIVQIKLPPVSSPNKHDTTKQATQIKRQSNMQAPKKSQSRVLDEPEAPRNLSSNKTLQNQFKDMKQKKQKYEKSIKTLQTHNDKLLEVIRKYEPNYNLEGKPKLSSPKKQNQNRSLTTRPASNAANTNFDKITETPQKTSNTPMPDQTIKQINNLKQSLGQKQKKLEQAIKSQQIAQQETAKYLKLLNQTKTNLTTVQQNLGIVNLQLQEIKQQKQEIEKKLAAKDQQLTQTLHKIQELKEQISQTHSTKTEDQELRAQIQKLLLDLEKQKNQKAEIFAIKVQLSAKLEEANQCLKQLKVKTKIPASSQSNLTEKSKQKIDQQSQNNQQQINKPSNSDAPIKTQQTQTENKIGAETPDHSSQAKQEVKQKTDEKDPGVIANQLLANIVKKNEELQVKRIEELLSSAQQVKQAYKKLKEKEAKIMVAIQSKEKKIDELDRTIQQKILERSDIQLEIAQMNDRRKQVSEMKQQIDQLTKEKLVIKYDIQKEREEFNKEQREQKEAFIRQIEKEKQDLIKIKKQSKQTLDKQQKQLAKIKEELTKNRADVEKAKKSIAQFLSKRNQIQKQLMPKQKLLRELTEKEKKIADKLKQADEQLAKKNQEKQKINALLQEVEQRRKQLTDLNEKIESKQISLKELQLQCYKKRDQYDRINKKIFSLEQSKKEFLELESKSKNITEDYEYKQKRLKELQAKIEENQKKQQRQNNQAAQLTKKSQEEAENAKRNIQKIKSLEQQAKEKLKLVEQQLYQKNKQKLKYGKYPNRFFIGQVLSSELEKQTDREFIIDLLMKMYPNRTITKTTLKFSYPLMKSINPHTVIDEIPHYIIIMKLANLDKRGQNYLLSMYSERPLSKYGETNKGRGFIASITNQKAFYLRTNTNSNIRVTQYSEFYFVFGNSELRFRLGSDSLETNIGHMYRSFETEDHKNAEIFTGTTQLNTTIDSYEIYQIQFNNKY